MTSKDQSYILGIILSACICILILGYKIGHSEREKQFAEGRCWIEFNSQGEYQVVWKK